MTQSWRFWSAPGGDGDLTVHVVAAGLRYLGRDDRGLHLVDPRTGRRLAYSDATWIDAIGNRTAVRSSYERDEIVLRVPQRTIEASRFPAVLDPVISAEFDLTSPNYGLAFDHQYAGSVAFDGTNYFLVWEDRREGYRLALFGARFSATGTLLDPGGILIRESNWDAGRPSVSFDGVTFVVVWGENFGIYGARVNRAGDLLDAPPALLVGGIGSADRPALAFDGAQYLVAWAAAGGSSGRDLHGALVSTDLRRLSEFTILATTGDQYGPVAEFDGVNYGVAWVDSRGGASTPDVYFARISTTGVVLDPGGVSLGAQTIGPPVLAHNGGAYLVAWSDRRLDTSGDVFAARVDSTGVVLDPGGFAVMTGPAVQNAPSAARLGGDYVVAWTDTSAGNGDVLFARVSTAGTVIDVTPLAAASSPDFEGGPFLGSGAAQVLVAFEQGGPTGFGYDIYATRVDVAGTVVDAPPTHVSRMAHPLDDPAVAFGVGRYLVAWSDSTDFRVHATRVGIDGAVLDAEGISIPTVSFAQFNPAVASDDANYLVVWQDRASATTGSALVATRIDPAGRVLDTVGILVDANERDSAPVAAFFGGNYVVAWQRARDALNADIYMARVSPGGSVLDVPPIRLSDAVGDHSRPAVAPGSTNALVVWTDYDGRYRTVGTRVDLSGRVLDGAGLAIGGGIPYAEAPAIAFDGSQFQIVWTQGTLWGARVSPGGVVLDPGGVPIGSGTATQRYPSITYNGSDDFVVWQGYDDYFLGAVDLYGTEVDATETVLDSPGFPVSTAPDREHTAGAASDAAGHALVVYTRRDTAHLYGTRRVRARVVSWLRNGAPCTVGADCWGRHCVDGVCCESACGEGVTTDCQACSLAAGSVADGSCGVVGGGAVCRSAREFCDLPEVCDGASASCPPDGTRTDGTACGDTLVCNGDEVCSGGSCAASLALRCDDADACTVDSCVEPSGCQHSRPAGCCNFDPECDDGDACTRDACFRPGGVCSNVPISACCVSDLDCVDGSACTLDTCDLATSRCQHVSVVGCCQIDLDCDDSDPCTNDSCDVPSTTCRFAPIPGCCRGDADCDDSNPCTADSCVALGCRHLDVDGCGAGEEADSDGGESTDIFDGPTGPDVSPTARDRTGCGCSVRGSRGAALPPVVWSIPLLVLACRRARARRERFANRHRRTAPWSRRLPRPSQ